MLQIHLTEGARELQRPAPNEFSPRGPIERLCIRQRRAHCWPDPMPLSGSEFHVPTPVAVRDRAKLVRRDGERPVTRAAVALGTWNATGAHARTSARSPRMRRTISTLKRVACAIPYSLQP